MRDVTARRWKVIGLIYAVCTFLGILLFGYRYFGYLTSGLAVPLLYPLTDELSSQWVTAGVFVALVVFVRRYRLRRGRWLRLVLLYVLALLAFSITHTILNGLLRSALYPLLGLGTYEYSFGLTRLLMEFFTDNVLFWTFVTVMHFVYQYQAARDQEVRSARLAAELTRSRLLNLKAQLQPHFLFNTLNTISSVMFDDPDKADRMIARLSDLLRLTLNSSEAQEVTLVEELELTLLYLDIMQIRLENRLTTRIDVDHAVNRALILSLLLQPLVENAVNHGVARRKEGGIVCVLGRRVGEALRLEVSDDGPGFDGAPHDLFVRGFGLRNTRERLRGLYGERCALDVMSPPEGGCTVIVELPYHDVGRALEADAADGAS